jgi:aminopeptidase N
VRPFSYVEINNFYTATVYEKGAEVVRMIKTLIGDEAFRRGMDLYFARHDGEAATVEDFVQCFRDASGRDLDQFFRWYEQAGTPGITAETKWSEEAHAFELKLTQFTKPTPGQPEKAPFHIPLGLGLVAPDGRDTPLDLEGTGVLNSPVIELTQQSQTFRFRNVRERPVLSLNRGFSAPVRVNAGLSVADRLFLAGRDSDPFNRWEMSQAVARDTIVAGMRMLEKGEEPPVPAQFAQSLAATLRDERLDPAFKALMLTLPQEGDLANDIGSDVDPDLVHRASDRLKARLGWALEGELRRIWATEKVEGPYSPDPISLGRRSLRHAALDLLAAADPSEGAQIALAHFRGATNMTNEIGALLVLTRLDASERETALAEFHAAHADDSLLVDKWLALHAQVPLRDTAGRVRELMRHAAFNLERPNRVRALIGTFAAANPVCFNAADGEGYRLVADVVMRLDGFNPQVASRIATSFRSWRILEPSRQAHAKAALETIKSKPGLSRDVYDIVTRCLAG